MDGILSCVVFAFAPKRPNRLGHKVWNQQLLAFAGYRQEDGTILGDPMTASLTDAIIALGWEPPAIRTRWDLLPLVTVADGDVPFITPIPADAFPVVNISHPDPRRALAFEKLGLSWVPAPALSGLGFDLGGLQYTAAPFIGWFMDAEIGVRDLADSFRYNCLPEIVAALDLIGQDQQYDELPQNQQLLLLSQAQAELNYAVHWSFTQAGVRMSDTLTAATMYTNFDDQHLETHGFRLPADPYWLAPPQGSIVPIWHRGSAPNYQPKPMICRQSRCPVVAWKRQTAAKRRPLTPDEDVDEVRHPSKLVNSNSDVPRETVLPTIYIVYCSSGVTAPRLAEKLKAKLMPLVRSTGSFSNISVISTLNILSLAHLQSHDIILVIASSAGRGDVPTNGLAALRALSGKQNLNSKSVSFAIFGNGNSSYGENFNGAAIKVQTAMEKAGFRSLLPMYKGDTLREDPPWKQFTQWFGEISNTLGVNDVVTDATDESMMDTGTHGSDFVDFLSQFSRAKLAHLDTHDHESMRLVSLNLGQLTYGQMEHVDVLIPLQREELEDILSAAGLNGDEVCEVDNKTWVARHLLSFVDIDKPFKGYEWAKSAGIELDAADLVSLAKMPLKDSLRRLASANFCKIDIADLIAEAPLRRPRTFSVASAPPRRSRRHVLDLVVQKRPGGLFTDKFLSTARCGDPLYARIRSGPGTSLADNSVPVVAFVTGSGIAPLRGLLQSRVIRATDAAKGQVGASPPTPPKSDSGISVFAGFKAVDDEVVNGCIRDAEKLGIIDIVCLLPSNPEKKRVQDRIFEAKYRDVIRSKIIEGGASVFVCASKEAVDDFARNLEAVVGIPSIREALGERWIEEVFVPANA